MFLKNEKYRAVSIIIGLLLCSQSIISGTSYSPYVEQTHPTNVYWGDTHLHTNLSIDAYNSGDKVLGPTQAYQFAKGAGVLTDSGQIAKLSRPLDFLVIADHAGNMGVMADLARNHPDLLRSSGGKRWAAMLREVNNTAKTDATESTLLSNKLAYEEGFIGGALGDDKYRHSVWQKAIALADSHNEPGKFTAFIGYEWTSWYYDLHRVVIFKDSQKEVGQVIPFSHFDSADPEDLWAYLDAYEKKTGGAVLAIPHNGNRSAGVMFALENAKGIPLTSSYAKTRSRWEPLYEVTQIKGDGETHPVLSPTDEFADYETLPSTNTHQYEAIIKERNLIHYDAWIAKYRAEGRNPGWLRRYEFARSALKLGLAQQATLGVNPFKFGMIGSTDAHSSLAAVDENNFWGKWGESAPHKNRILGSWRPANKKGTPGWRMNAAGYAAVWAEENTREALFAAMKRKETYATTGPRMTVRFFGGWDYEEEDAFRPDLASIGYSKGVPMGGDLTNAPKGKAPRFLIHVVKDPEGANLDRLQVIKGWYDKNGGLTEKIYNVALSDGRKENWRDKVKSVGNTVSIEDASYTNSIGDPELTVVWKDPGFNKDELAFYYLRVLEIPTPRWTAYDAKFFGIKDIPKEVPMITQERAYTSPIWYSPRRD